MPLAARLQIFDGELASHAVPASLRHRISDDEWEAMAFAVEDAMAMDMRFQWIGLTVCLGIPLAGVLMTWAMVARQATSIDNNWDFAYSYNPFALLGLLPPILIITIIIMTLVQQICIRPKVIDEVNDVLAEASSTHHGVSFHLMGHGSREDPFYIEVFEESSFSSYYTKYEADSRACRREQRPDIEMGNQTPWICTNKAPKKTSIPPPSTRLEELEKIKHLLSIQEYDAKRQAILADL